ncbi:hypothetical protein [Mesorhizobium sp. M8A.F.Ca.ET.021.01.1.1]|uniref:hypothetical protein n=1 Tax=Mesorhizobium sp. M8A.F.Ca.ET.021.01.1.1 TaxID=2496757 RepID=UPI000FCA318E|nr:hypothetical protein [Mesorhizobium sp. M8A.F.Ca.ET.021.01.1.1]RUW45664.1 hypothetical protein EOA36_27655 [Mesorhizobium sp. M8A.F.Ca.ET.021.01.1.1]
MRAMAVFVDVPNRELPVGARRVVGLMEDNATVGVCAMRDGDRIVNTEIEFNLAEAARLAELILSGDQRAKTTPGLARILSASVAMLFRVSIAAGALQRQQEAFDGGDAGHLDDQQEAGGEEDPNS